MTKEPPPPDIGDMVTAYLREHGYDGLCNPELECGCELADLMPCDYPDLQACVPGFRGPPTPDGGDWAMYPTRQTSHSKETNT